MSDEMQDKMQDNQEQVVDETQSKQSNRTFTQSEFDSAIKKEVSKIKEQFKDYDTIKSEYDELQKWKKEKELNEMNEMEKLNAQLEEARKQTELLMQENQNLNIQTLRNTVLSDIKYNGLPRAYKSLVQGETIDSIKENAEKVLEEFQADLKLLSGQQQQKSILPDSLNKPDSAKSPILSPAERVKQAIENAKKRKFGG